VCASDTKITFKDTVNKLLLADSADANESDEAHRTRSRRVPEAGGIKGNAVPDIPDHVLQTARNCNSAASAIGVILKWKRVKNEHNRDIRPDELQQHKPNSKKSSNSSHKKGGKDQKKQKRRRLSLGHNEPSKARRANKTRQVSAGLKEATVQVSIKEPEDPEPSWTDSDSDQSEKVEETSNNIDNTSTNGNTTARSKKKRRNRRKQRRLRARRTGRKRRQARIADPKIRTIWDTGTDVEIIGKGWHIDHYWTGHTLTIDGPLEGMDGQAVLPIVAGVTAHDTKDGPILIGIGVTAYDSRATQEESLLNPNAISKFCDIDERPEHRDGRQSLLTECGEVKIHVENGRLPYSCTRMPTERELQFLPINWIVPKCNTVLEETLTRARRSGAIEVNTPAPSM